MDPSNSFVLAAIAAGLSSVCVVLSLWAFVRLSAIEARVADIDTKLPPKRVAELEQAFDALTQAFEAMQQKNLEFKQSVHNSVNRLDQVMRRNEAAVSSMMDEDGNLRNAEEMPDVVKVASPEDQVQVSKQKALQLRWNRNRGLS